MTFGVDSGDDFVVGDNGFALFDTSSGVSLMVLVTTTDPEHGGADFIFAADGSDLVLGGSEADMIDAGTDGSPDYVHGDNGFVMFDLVETPTGLSNVLKAMATIAPSIGGNDQILVGNGDDVVIAGIGDDLVNYTLGPAGAPVRVGTDDVGDDVIVGDVGWGLFDTTSGQPVLQEVASSFPQFGGADYLFAANGSDVVLGGSGIDIIDAGTDPSGDLANDVVIGDNGAAKFDTAAGYRVLRDLTTTAPEIGADDVITAGGGSDVVFGGTGADRIDTGADDYSDVVVGDNGYALFNAAGILVLVLSSDPIFGGNDVIFTGNGPDLVIGGRGADLIDAGSDASGDFGRDAVFGDYGQAWFDDEGRLLELVTMFFHTGDNDTISTGGGNDVIIGGFRDDYIQSGGDDDLVIGDSGLAWFLTIDRVRANDFQFAQSTDPLWGGQDVIRAGNGSDVVFGGGSNDEIHGGGNSDLLLGDHGQIDRSLPANQQWVSIYSGAGDGGGDDLIVGDDGDAIDEPASDGTGSSLLDLAGIVAPGGEMMDVLAIFGGDFDDVIVGQQGDDVLRGGPGNDDITGGHNVAGGADGSDTIDGQAGADVVAGDNAVITRSADPITGAWRRYAAPFGDVIRAVRRLDDVDLVGAADRISGGSGRDRLHGQRGNDRIDGDAGDDSIFGELGADVLDGGPGADVSLGGAGLIIGALDTEGAPVINADGSWHRDVYLERVGVVVDSVVVGQAQFWNPGPALGQRMLNADLLFAASVAPRSAVRSTMLVMIMLDDADESDVLTGGAGNDALFGGVGEDTIDGQDGDDFVFGGTGDDTLFGGAGSDLVVGDGIINAAFVGSDLPRVLTGYRIIGDDSIGPSRFTLGYLGTAILPVAELRPSEHDCPSSGTLAAQVNALESANSLETLEGTAMSPFIAIVPDALHHRSVAAGNDFLDGGFGPDVVYGDHLSIGTARFAGIELIEDAFADLDDALAGALRAVQQLGIAYESVVNLDGAGRSTHLAHGFSFGLDTFAGGELDDVLFEGDGRLVTTTIPTNMEPAGVADAMSTYEQMLRKLERSAIDTSAAAKASNSLFEFASDAVNVCT
jgi:Ca2+-binding RTX toxin-like protein